MRYGILLQSHGNMMYIESTSIDGQKGRINDSMGQECLLTLACCDISKYRLLLCRSHCKNFVVVIEESKMRSCLISYLVFPRNQISYLLKFSIEYFNYTPI